MKTVFRKGMKVYDQIYEPDVKGEVLDVNLDISPHPITVKFGSCVRYYTAEGCRGRNQIRTLSTSPYRIEGFEQKAPVPTYEDAEEWIRKEYEKGNNYLMLKDTFEALRKLTILREYYNKGWQPDWSTVTWKYFIIVRRVYPIVEFEVDCSAGIPHVLSFKTRDIAKKFLEEQKELLEIAKPLL